MLSVEGSIELSPVEGSSKPQASLAARYNGKRSNDSTRTERFSLYWVQSLVSRGSCPALVGQWAARHPQASFMSCWCQCCGRSSRSHWSTSRAATPSQALMKAKDLHASRVLDLHWADGRGEMEEESGRHLTLTQDEVTARQTYNAMSMFFIVTRGKPTTQCQCSLLLQTSDVQRKWDVINPLSTKINYNTSIH